ncbi:MAG: hypothetical protein RMI83_00595 [Desulfurococcaceae archaeon]|nr:hypothetical protein [Sulfolobales archaeon]MDW8169596.1 hypothetical protein [Desulfurococcaceae archaeon]
MRSRALLLLLLAFTLLLRLTPYIESLTPYSTDSWGLLRNAMVLIANSPIDLSEGVFDGYNNYWPAASILSAITVVVTNGDLYIISQFMPVLSFLAFITILYSIGRRVSKYISVLHLITYVGLFYNYLLMTGGFTKEAMAYPLYALILYFSYSEKSSLRMLVLCLSAGFGLAFTHHLTTLVALLTLLATLCYEALGALGIMDETRVFNMAIALLTLLLCGFVQYISLGRYSALAFASTWLGLSLASSTLLTVLIACGVEWLIGFSRNKALLSSRFKAIASVIAAYALMHLAIAIATWCMGSHWLTQGVLFLAIGFSIPVILAVEFIREAYGERPIVVIPWILSILALDLFVVAEEIPNGFSILYRSTSFLALPLFLAASMSTSSVKRFSLLITGLYASIMLSAYILTQMGLTPELGWHWRYSISDYLAAGYLHNYYKGAVCSDVKYGSILRGLFSMSVSNWSSNCSGAIVLSLHMFTKGMLLSPGVLRRINVDELCSLLLSNSLVYNSGGGQWFFYS